MLQFEEQKLKLENIREDIKELGEALGIEKLTNFIEEKQNLTAAENFWDDPENSQKVLQEISRAKEKLESYEKLAENFKDTFNGFLTSFQVFMSKVFAYRFFYISLPPEIRHVERFGCLQPR